MKYLCYLLGWLLLVQPMPAADEAEFISVCSSLDSDISLPLEQQHVALDWRVPVAKWLKTPRWTPEKEPVPLDAYRAAVAARRWINAQPWADRFVQFTNFDLQNWLGPVGKNGLIDGLWYYSVNFELKDDEHDKLPHTAIVLLDGTVIEPIKPPPPAKATP